MGRTIRREVSSCMEKRGKLHGTHLVGGLDERFVGNTFHGNFDGKPEAWLLVWRAEMNFGVDFGVLGERSARGAGFRRD